MLIVILLERLLTNDNWNDMKEFRSQASCYW